MDQCRTGDLLPTNPGIQQGIISSSCTLLMEQEMPVQTVDLMANINVKADILTPGLFNLGVFICCRDLYTILIIQFSTIRREVAFYVCLILD
jgi:hypothetical protein